MTSFRADKASTRNTPGRRKPRRDLKRFLFDALEPRQLLTVTPGPITAGQLYQDVAFMDAHGDTVEVSINGPTSVSTGFTLGLAGGATNNADINNLNLLGESSGNNLIIQVTPNPMTITGGGGNFVQIFSSGYVHVTSITANSDKNYPNAAKVTDLGGIQLSAAIVKSIALPGVNIGNVTVDAGEVPYVDRVNSSNLNTISIGGSPTITGTGNATLTEIMDESPVGHLASYTPRTGLVGLYDLEAQSVGALVINSATPMIPSDAFDTYDTMNDFEGTIKVNGAIGSLVGPNSVLKGTVIAGSLGSADLGAISGTITTTDPTQPFTFTLPEEFSGVINTAGHLNLGFPQTVAQQPTATDVPQTASQMTGQIISGGGISGLDSASQADALIIPSGYPGVVTNTSKTSGIADLVFNGVAQSQWYSASSLGAMSASTFVKGFIAQAGTNIGDVTSSITDVAGHFQAGGNIGNVTAAVNIPGDLIAGGNIAAINGLTGGLTGNIISAGGNIGNITVIQLTPALTQITAGGNIGNIHMVSGQWDARVKARNIGNVTVQSGNLLNAVFVATTGSIGNITVTSKQGAAISGGSIIAGTSIGQVSADAFEGTAILGTLIQAGNPAVPGGPAGSITGVTGISYGALELPPVVPGVAPAAAQFNGIDSAQILAGQIGPILGQGYVGFGIKQAVIHSQVGGIASITGIGNADGINATTVVSESGIGPIHGLSTVQGAGIFGGSFDANGKTDPTLGSIAQITAQGGPAGGQGIQGTRFQATGNIVGISGTANANGGNAIDTISAYATSYGPIYANVLGGQTGNGLFNSTLKAWSDYTNNRPNVQMAGIYADVRSALGAGITGSTISSKGDLEVIHSVALNGAAIARSMFTLSSGDFGSIYAQSINGGNAIDGTTFDAGSGSIGSATDLASVGTSGITAIANAASPLANAISGSTFLADANIGFISASANGGTAILNSIFTADTNAGNPNNGPNLPGSNQAGNGDLGAIFGIKAYDSGQNLAASAGIAGSSFEAELIGSITVDVIDRESGGPGIIGSIFTARNAVYDNQGNFNNTGKIGVITVTDGSIRANGIDTSTFTVGAAGAIGDINVTTLGGTGINASSFSAAAFDYDQSLFTSKIGNINVNAGRAGSQLLTLPAPPNDAWSLMPAGISTSSFIANAGIGNLNVNSIGTGVFASAFLANSASKLGYGIPGLILPFLAPTVPGNMGNINIHATGRFGAGSIFSVYAGDNLGNIQLQVASRDPNGTPLTLPKLPGVIGAAFQFVENVINYAIQNVGPAASAGSIFYASNGNIGKITATNAGPGANAILSAFVAVSNGGKGTYGAVNNIPEPNWFNVLIGNTDPIFKNNLFYGNYRSPGTNPSDVPTAAATSVTPPAPKLYKAGETLNFTVNFSGSVTVVGQPSLPVKVGGVTRQALYHSGSNSSQLIFSLTMVVGDTGTISVPAGTQIQTGLDHRISDSATGLEVTQLAPGAVTTPGIVALTVPAKKTSVSALLSASGATHTLPYKAGELLTVIVSFNEAVVVHGLPTLAFHFTAAKNHDLVYSSGSGTNTLRFTYKVTAADVKLHTLATLKDGKIHLPAKAKIQDLAGNNATL